MAEISTTPRGAHVCVDAAVWGVVCVCVGLEMSTLHRLWARYAEAPHLFASRQHLVLKTGTLRHTLLPLIVLDEA